jgi:hypothetical protein
LTQLVLREGALDGLIAPAVITVVSTAAVAGLVLLVKGYTGAVPQAQSVEQTPVQSLKAVAVQKQRAGRWASNPVDHGDALVYVADGSAPPSLRQATRQTSRGETFLMLHSGLQLGDQRADELSQRKEWLIRLVDQEVVSIASADRELLPFSEFIEAKARQMKRWKIYGASLLAAAFLGLILFLFLNRFNHKGVKS